MIAPHFVPKIHDEAQKECNHMYSNCYLQSLDSEISVSFIKNGVVNSGKHWNGRWCFAFYLL